MHLFLLIQGGHAAHILHVQPPPQCAAAWAEDEGEGLFGVTRDEGTSYNNCHPTCCIYTIGTCTARYAQLQMLSAAVHAGMGPL